MGNGVQIFGGPKWIELAEKNLPFDVEFGRAYTIKVIASADGSYDVSISDGEREYLILDNFKKATDLKIGSIGLRSFFAASTFFLSTILLCNLKEKLLCLFFCIVKCVISIDYLLLFF